MNIQVIESFSNTKLFSSLKSFFETERQTTHIILLHLKEIQVRKLFADYGYANMFTMLIQHFQQSETAANQRLQALKLMNAVPEVEEKLKAGEVNLSTLAKAQRQISREEKITGHKVEASMKSEIIVRISSKTLAQAEKELMILLPESSKTLETADRRISKDETRLSLTFPDRVRQKMEEFKNHITAANPRMDHIEVIERALDIAIEKVDPLKKRSRLQKVVISNEVDPTAEVDLKKPKHGNETTHNRRSATQTANLANDFVSSDEVNKISEFTPADRAKRKTYFSIVTDRTLWEKANSQCEYVDHVTRKRCTCRSGLERDHIAPLALGGSNDITNLRLLCRTHNQLFARQHFGSMKIQNEIDRSRSKSN